MTIHGFDCVTRTTIFMDKISKSPAKFCGRYYSYHDSKNLNLPEAQALSKIPGFKIVSVFEAGGNRFSAFSGLSGQRDAHQAVALAKALGQPKDSAIYFAVDYDAPVSQIRGSIATYFEAAGETLGEDYYIGVYGSGSVCENLTELELVNYTWLGGATGWTGYGKYRNSGDWNIVQGLPGDLYGFGFQVDPDEAVDDDFGGWSLAA